MKTALGGEGEENTKKVKKGAKTECNPTSNENQRLEEIIRNLNAQNLALRTENSSLRSAKLYLRQPFKKREEI